MDMEKARKVISEQLTTDRYEHTLRVCETALDLADHFGESTQKTAIASMFHDYAKCTAKETLKEHIVSFKLPERLLDYHHELWHAPVGAGLVKKRYGISDEDVLNAIRYHTTGRSEMSQLELIIFVSDYIEPARNFPGVDEVREVAKVNLEVAARLALKNTIIFLINKNATIFPDTLHAYNELTKKGVVVN